MSKAKNFVARAKQRGKTEAQKEAMQTVRAIAERPRPTVVHSSPRVDTAPIAGELKQVLPLLEKIAEKSAPELDLSGVEKALKDSSFNPAALVKAVTQVARAVGEQSAVLERLNEFEATQVKIVDALGAVTDALVRQAEAQEAHAKAYSAKRTLRFTEGGAVLEAK